MIEGYTTEKFGVIKKIEPCKFDYGSAYQKILLGRGEGNMRMAYLRYGYLAGTLGRTPGSSLDVGYGDGAFLSVCTALKHTECYGNELDPQGLPAGCTFVTDITSKLFDVICFFDSLEHFEDISFLERLQCNHIYVSIPNCVYLSDEWFQNWFHRKPEQHIRHFNYQSMTKLLASYRYELMAYSYIESMIRESGTDILTMIFKRA
jgi:hypothetical protein